MKQEINGENFLGALRRQDERALDYLVEHYAGLIRSVVSRKLYALPAWQEDCPVSYTHLDVYKRQASRRR